jgi:hypothetical protein
VVLRERAVLNMNGFSMRGTGGGVGIWCGSSRGRRSSCRIDGPGVVGGFSVGMGGDRCRITVDGVLLEGNTFGVAAPESCRVNAANVNVLNSALDGISATRVRVWSSWLSNNRRHGVVAKRIAVRALVATHNGGHGVLQFPSDRRFGRMAHSTVVGNGGGHPSGVDIVAAGRLRLRQVRCRRSEQVKEVNVENEATGVVGSFGCLDD